MGKSDINNIISALEKTYPDAHCELDFGSVFELLVAVILSAQCTDKRVNEVTKTLFKRANTPKAFAEMPTEELEKLIYSCGFYRNKAKNIKSMSLDVLTRFGGKVPEDFDELLSLAGVGRKTANVVTSVAYGGDGIAVDTHVFRVSHRLGLSDGKTPYDVEKDLTALIEPQKRADAHHLLIFHGRYCCKSQRPDCGKCPVIEYCEEVGGKTKGE
ncbi:MAG: endonuclease III [Clostridia bacterium]|jgi:endonuclease-3|nr:endonuclease III [Clostridia bacterium]